MKKDRGRKEMLVEKIIFTMISIYLLLAMFFKLIRKIDKIYISVLAIQLLGLVLGLIEIIFILNYPIIIKMLMYLIAVVIPIAIILMERRGKNFSEFVYMLLAKCYQMTRKY